MRLVQTLAAAALIAATPAFAALAPGAKAPDFTTRGAIAGKVFTVHLAEQLKKGPVVLYFFPAAFTGGCNAEAKAFADAVSKAKPAGAKGQYVQRVAVTSSMGPGVKVEPASVLTA